jgi:hypothetical protein
MSNKLFLVLTRFEKELRFATSFSLTANSLNKKELFPKTPEPRSPLLRLVKLHEPRITEFLALGACFKAAALLSSIFCRIRKKLIFEHV